jgi:hypothetical protein
MKPKKRVWNLGLPEGADKDQFLKIAFVIGNIYWFKRENSFILGTNFRITPLFQCGRGTCWKQTTFEVINHEAIRD